SLAPPSRPSSLTVFFFLIPPPPISTLFPYTTLFRSLVAHVQRLCPGQAGDKVLGQVHQHKAGGVPQLVGKVAGGLHLLFAVAHEIGRDTSELQSRFDLVCRLLLEKKKIIKTRTYQET